MQQASGNLLVGEDVSDRPWFRNGLRGPFARSVHDVPILAGILSPDDPDALRVIDLAMPVTNGLGEVIGVAALYIDISWAARVLREEAQRLGLELYLVSSEGDVLLTTDGSTPGPAELQILRAALPGTESAARETWPDGRSYFSSLVPQLRYEDLPNFGWRLIGRLDADTFTANVAWLRGIALVAIFALVCVLVGLTAAFVMIFIRPLERLASEAVDIADGKDIYPPDATRTRELGMLSAALARLQAQARR